MQDFSGKLAFITGGASGIGRAIAEKLSREGMRAAWPGLLRAAGYRTGAFVGAAVLNSEYGLAKGFEIYDARLGLSGRVGIVFDYLVRAEYRFRDDQVRLLDASLGNG